MRIELIHSMMVHFPIALLYTGVAIRFAAVFASKRPKISFLLPASWLILALGVIAAWIAILTGEIAKDIVKPTLENLSFLHEHAQHANLAAYGFTIGLLIDGARAFALGKLKKGGWLIQKGLLLAVWFVYLFSLTHLIIAAKYGGDLVYEEGAAVEKNARK